VLSVLTLNGITRIYMIIIFYALPKIVLLLLLPVVNRPNASLGRALSAPAPSPARSSALFHRRRRPRGTTRLVVPSAASGGTQVQVKTGQTRGASAMSEDHFCLRGGLLFVHTANRRTGAGFADLKRAFDVVARFGWPTLPLPDPGSRGAMLCWPCEMPYMVKAVCCLRWPGCGYR
jgi:hypothetical protein